MPDNERKKSIREVELQCMHRGKGNANLRIIQRGILGSDSRTFSHVVPSVMGHHYPTEKYSENATQVKQLHYGYTNTSKRRPP